VIRVGPRGIFPRRRYGRGAIAAALALWAIFSLKFRGPEMGIGSQTIVPRHHTVSASFEA